MRFAHIGFAGKVRNRPRDTQHTVIATCGQAEAFGDISLRGIPGGRTGAA